MFLGFWCSQGWSKSCRRRCYRSTFRWQIPQRLLEIGIRSVTWSIPTQHEVLIWINWQDLKQFMVFISNCFHYSASLLCIAWQGDLTIRCYSCYRRIFVGWHVGWSLRYLLGTAHSTRWLSAVWSSEYSRWKRVWFTEHNFEWKFTRRFLHGQFGVLPNLRCEDDETIALQLVCTESKSCVGSPIKCDP